MLAETNSNWNIFKTNQCDIMVRLHVFLYYFRVKLLKALYRYETKIFKWVWFGGVCVEALNDNTIIQPLKEY